MLEAHMKNKPVGICHICGQTKELTEEHIPPRGAGNTKTVKFHTLNDFLHEDHISGKKQLSEFKYQQSQGGFHIPTICKECNNNTGSFYAPAYSDFARIIYISLSKYDVNKMLNHNLTFKCQLKPLNIYKQILAMFCSILTPQTVDTYKFGDFILDKNANSLNDKQNKLHMFLVPSNSAFKSIPAYGIYNTNNGKFIMISELIAPPFGFVLNLTPNSVSINLPDLSTFCDFSYDEITTLGFEIPFLKPLQSFMMYEGIPQNKIIMW